MPDPAPVDANTSERRSLPIGAIVAFVAVLLIKFAVFFEIGSNPLLVPSPTLDDGVYALLADRVAHGDVLLSSAASFAGHPAPPFFLPPLYIYVLAFFMKIGGASLPVVRIGQILLGSAGVALLAATTRRWYGESAASWVTIGAALFGLVTFFELLVGPAAIDPFLTALDLLLITRAIDRRTPGAWALAGIALGLHTLNHPSLLIVLVGLAASVAVWGLRRSEERSRALVGAVSLLVAGFAAIAPATVRNWHVSREFVLTTSAGGFHALAGNGPEATGVYARAMGIEPNLQGVWLEAPVVASRALGHAATATETSEYFRGVSEAWVDAHPIAELRLLARKTRYALSATFVSTGHSFPFFARDELGALTLCAVGPALVVPLGLVGLVVARPAGRAGYWLWAMYVPLAMLSMVIFFVAAAYRLPMQVALLVPAAGGAASMFNRLRARSWSAFGGAAGATAVLALFVAWPTGLDDGRAEEQVRLGMYEIRTGRVEEGEAWIKRALPAHPSPFGVQLRVGQLYESMNRPSDAITHFRAAQAIAPNDPSVPFAIGRAMFAGGQDAEAIAELERARVGPQADAATRVLVLVLSRMGRRDEANQLVRTLDPARWTADQAREFAVGLASVGRLDLSVTAWQRAADAGGDAHDYERLGLSWVLIGRPADSIAPLEEAVRRAPTSATIRLNYAVALSTVGRRDDARREATKAIELDPSYQKAQQFLQSLGK